MYRMQTLMYIPNCGGQVHKKKALGTFFCTILTEECVKGGIISLPSVLENGICPAS
jgi:hypothetical protein